MDEDCYGKHYFRVEGRILPIDILLKVAENEYKEKGKSKEWKNRQNVVLSKRFSMEKISFENLNGKNVAQAVEVFILVADQLKLCGTNKEEISRSHNVLLFLNQMFNKIGEIKFKKGLDKKGRTKACSEYFQSSQFNSFGNTFIDQLQRKGNNFFLGRKLSAVDVFYLLAMKFTISLYPKALSRYPALEDYTKKLISHHLVKKVLDQTK